MNAKSLFFWTVEFSVDFKHEYDTQTNSTQTIYRIDSDEKVECFLNALIDFNQSTDSLPFVVCTVDSISKPSLINLANAVCNHYLWHHSFITFRDQHIRCLWSLYAQKSKQLQSSDSAIQISVPVQQIINQENSITDRLYDVWDVLMKAGSPHAHSFQEDLAQIEAPSLPSFFGSLLHDNGIGSPPPKIFDGMLFPSLSERLSQLRNVTLTGRYDLEYQLKRATRFVPRGEILRAQVSWQANDSLSIIDDFVFPDVIAQSPALRSRCTISMSKDFSDRVSILSDSEHIDITRQGLSISDADPSLQQKVEINIELDMSSATVFGVHRCSTKIDGCVTEFLAIHVRRPTTTELISDVHSFHASNELNWETFSSLRGALDQALSVHESIDLYLCSLILNARFQWDHAQTFLQYEKLKKFMTSNGQGKEFIDLVQGKLKESLGDFTISAHGYYRSLASRNKESVWSSVHQIIAEIDRLGYRSFLNSGTLLGIIREGDFIAHDDDVDLAVILQSSDHFSAAKEWREFKNSLARIGKLDTKFDASTKGHAKFINSSGVSVDIFPAWIVDGKFYVWPYCAGGVSVSEVGGLVPVSVCGLSFPVPEGAESLLAQNYGNGWRTPDPTFKFDWGRAFKRFPDFLSKLS